MAATEPASQEARNPAGHRAMVVFVVFLFFAWGFATVLIDTLIPKLKALFSLNYAEVMLTQFAFFLGYLVFSMPAAVILSRIGYTRSIVLGLLVMAAGCLLFVPAASAGVFEGFLLALFVMAAGITTLQTAANPYMAVLGPESTSSSRLTLAQAFNSLGTTIGPLVGAAFILADEPSLPAGGLSGDALAAARHAEASAVLPPFLGIAATLVVVAIVFWKKRNSDTTVTVGGAASLGESFRVLRRPRLALGAASIFVYVGAEVAIGSLLVNYLMQPDVLDVPAARAGQLVSLYWGGAMVGRFIGSAVLRMVSPGKVLACVAVGAIALIALSTNTTGMLSGYSLLAIGLMNAIMFPTIFSLACEKLGSRAADGSGIINVAIFGGAVIPLLTGVIADVSGSLSFALVLPAACYAIIAGFGIYARKPAVA